MSSRPVPAFTIVKSVECTEEEFKKQAERYKRQAEEFDRQAEQFDKQADRQAEKKN